MYNGEEKNYYNIKVHFEEIAKILCVPPSAY